jgi:hypothetical protein
MRDPVDRSIRAYVKHRQEEALGLGRDFPEFQARPWCVRLWYWLVSL